MGKFAEKVQKNLHLLADQLLYKKTGNREGNREALVDHVNNRNLQLLPPPFTFPLSLSIAVGLRGTPGSCVLPLIAPSHKRCGG